MSGEESENLTVVVMKGGEAYIATRNHYYSNGGTGLLGIWDFLTVSAEEIEVDPASRTLDRVAVHKLYQEGIDEIQLGKAIIPVQDMRMHYVSIEPPPKPIKEQ